MRSFTRRHYEVLAACFGRALRQHPDPAQHQAVTNTITEVVMALEKDNPSGFKRTLFMSEVWRIEIGGSDGR